MVYTTYSGASIDVAQARKNAIVRDNGQLIMPMADIIRWKLTVARPKDLAYCAELLDLLNKEAFLLPETQHELTDLLREKQQDNGHSFVRAG